MPKEIAVKFSAAYLREIDEYPDELMEKIRAKTFLFAEDPRHPSLHTHKLHGKLRGCCAFSVGYDLRVIFRWEDHMTAVFLAIGDHDDYERVK